MKKFSRYVLIFALVVVLFVPTILLLSGCDETYVYEGVHYTIRGDYAEVNYFISEDGGAMVCEVPSEVEYEGKIYPITVVRPYYGAPYSASGSFVDGGYVSEIILPSTVTDFRYTDYDGYYGYGNCDFKYLEKITVHSDNEVYSDVDGVLFDAKGEELLYYPPYRQDETYTVPKGMQTINPYSMLWRSEYITNIQVDAENPYYTSDGNVLFSKDGSELVYRVPSDEVYFAIPSTVSVVCYNALPNVDYLYVPKSVTLFLDSFVYERASIKYIDHVFFESDTLPNYLTKSDLYGQLYFGKTLDEFEAAVGNQHK